MKSVKQFDSKWIKLYQETKRGHLFASRRDTPYLEEHDKIKCDAVVVIAYDLNGRLLVVKEHRPVLDSHIYAFPAGLVDEGETFVQAAVREVKEETGLELWITSSYHNSFTSPGMTDEKVGIAVGYVEGELQQDEKETVPLLLGPDEIAQIVAAREPMSIWLALHLIGG